MPRLLVLVLLQLQLQLAFVSAAPPSAVVSLVSSAPINNVTAAFASFNLDPSCNRGFHNTVYSNPNLVAAAAGLLPAVLRFGGSGADALVYGLADGAPECASVPPVASCEYVTPGCLNASHWSELYALARDSGVDLLFGISFGFTQACAPGEGAGYVWNASNAEAFLKQLQQRNETAIWGFELGNEVNNNAVSCNLTAAQQAAAFAHFAALLKAAQIDARIVGPDTGYLAAEAWLAELLPALAPGTLHAATHHVYDGVKRDDFNSPAQLDSSLPEIAWYTEMVSALVPTAEIWAGENGPIGGGNDGTCGADTVCGTYASTIWYADDMALRAKHGFVHYQRQDLFGAAYGLTNSVSGAMALNAKEPLVLRPDYWLAFLHKRTLGQSVLNATSSTPLLRAYAYAGAPPSPYAASECAASSLQLLLIHLGSDAAMSVELPAAGAGAAAQYAAWTLAPTAAGGAFGLTAQLNGAALPSGVDVSRVDPATYLRAIQAPAAVGTISAGITLPPLSTTFLCY